MKELPIGFRKRKNGSLEYRFFIGSARVSVSGQSVTECRKKERERREQAVAGGVVRDDKITVAKYFDLWLEQRKRTVKESTAYAESVRFLPIRERIGDVRITKLTRRQIINLQASLAEEYGSTAVNHRITLLRSMLKAAVLDEIIGKNPADGVKSLKRAERPANETIHRALTVQEQMVFFQYAEKSWYCELFMFMVQSGVRIGEACALKWSDVDFRLGIIRIRRTMMRTKNGEVLGSSPKSRSGIRDIPINTGIKSVLIRQREKLKWVMGEKAIRDDAFIFLGTNGKPARTNNVNVIIEGIAKRAGIEKISSHCFRDTFATRAIEQGMNPQTLKTILGHSSLAMTMDLYAHVMPNTRKDEMDRITIQLPERKDIDTVVIKIPTERVSKSPQNPHTIPKMAENMGEAQ